MRASLLLVQYRSSMAIAAMSRMLLLMVVVAAGSGCASTLLDPRTQLEAAGVNLGSDDFSKHYEDAFGQYQKIFKVMKGANATVTTDAADLANYVKAGFTYVDRKCGEYFNILHAFYKKKREAVNTTNLLTALVSGVMAATKAKAAEIAVVAVTGSAAAALLDNHGSALLFELDPSATEGLVRKALEAWRGEADAQPPTSFSDALDIVQTYATICLPSSIEKLVKDAVTAANPTTQPPTTPGAPVSGGEAGTPAAPKGLPQPLGAPPARARPFPRIIQ